MMRRRLLMMLFLMTAAVVPARAQEPPAPAPAPIPAPDTTRKLLSPTGAFARSLLLPGWGQGSVGAYKRGGIFFAIQSTSWYMLLKTLSRLGDAREREERGVEFVTADLQARMETDTMLARVLADPLKFQEAVDTAQVVARARDLVDARKQQRQDWVTYTLFFTLASGLDAYIAAQLADFPATLVTRPAPSGGLQLHVTVPVRGP